MRKKRFDAANVEGTRPDFAEQQRTRFVLVHFYSISVNCVLILKSCRTKLLVMPGDMSNCKASFCGVLLACKGC